MIGKTLAPGKHLSLHYDDRGWVIVGRGDDLERIGHWIVDDPPGEELWLFPRDGTTWVFGPRKWLGKNHCTAILKQVKAE